MKNYISPLLTSLFTLTFFFSTSQFLTAELVRTTAYTHTEKDHIKYGKRTASGKMLSCKTSYTSAAADWSEFPLGTKFRIKGEATIYVIDDYGSALVGTRTIDIYCPSRSAMNEWGVRHVEIEILEFGSFEKSAKLLAGRTKWSHCKAMFEAIRNRDRDTTV